MRWSHEPFSGQPIDVPESLHKVLGAFTRHNDHIMIGRTNDPDRRWTEYYGPEEWRELVPMYYTRSMRNASAVETELIDYGRDQGYQAEVWNQNRGGGGRPVDGQDIYVYVALE